MELTLYIGDYLVTDNVSSMNFVLVKPVRVALEDHFHRLKSDPMRALVPILDHIHEFLERIRTSVKGEKTVCQCETR